MAGSSVPPQELADRSFERILLVKPSSLGDVIHALPVLHAAALDRQLVCITGPTNPAPTGPYQRLEDVVGVDLDCSPCYLRQLSQCRHDHRCMQELAVATVLSSIERRLLEPASQSE